MQSLITLMHGSITIRNLDDNVKKRLRKQAAENGRSLEAEARDILSRIQAQPRPRAPLKRDSIYFAVSAKWSRNMAVWI